MFLGYAVTEVQVSVEGRRPVFFISQATDELERSLNTLKKRLGLTKTKLYTTHSLKSL